MHALVGLFHSLTVREWLTAACDILIVYYVIYRTLLLIKGTRAAQMLIGIVLVGAGFFAAKLLELTTLSWLLDNLINYSIIFFIVIFQHDIRRGLMRVGQNLFAQGRKFEETFIFEEVIKAADALSHARIGALIVLEREADQHLRRARPLDEEQRAIDDVIDDDDVGGGGRRLAPAQPVKELV